MYDFEQICELVRLVGSTGVASLEISSEGVQLRIKGRPALKAAAMTQQGVEALSQVVLDPNLGDHMSQTPPDASAEADETLHKVTSPIVGTFYRAPSPDADPYVKVGDFVEKGQVLCIVEAMKLMNEIEADATGTIVKIFCENAQPVEFSQPLFALRPA